MAPTNCYAVLRIPENADAAEIKRAWRSLAFSLHPDRNRRDPAALERFLEAAEAYCVLADPARRAGHDRLLARARDAAKPTRQARAAPETVPPVRAADDDARVFGESPRFKTRVDWGPETWRPGASLRLDLDLHRRQAEAGCEVDVDVPIRSACPECQGSGRDHDQGGLVLENCPHCRGTGRMSHPLPPPPGRRRMSRVCTACLGRGSLYRSRCRRCLGRGFAHLVRRVRVFIPPGSTHGRVVRVRGAGEPGRGGAPAGDLFVVLAVRGAVLSYASGWNTFVFPWLHRG
jgi:molecular chaperone DnaJ